MSGIAGSMKSHQFAVGFTIAGAVGMKDFRRDNFAPFVEEYLTQRHSVSGHMGRAIPIRAIIDWYFWKERRRDDLTMHLEDVGMGSPLIHNTRIRRSRSTQSEGKCWKVCLIRGKQFGRESFQMRVWNARNQD